MLIKNKGNSQHIYVKEFNKFIYNNRKHKEWLHLQWFISEEILLKHQKVFLEVNGKLNAIIPEKAGNVQFTRHHDELKAPFVVYPDLDSNLKEVQRINKNNPDKSFLDKYQDDIVVRNMD